LLADGSESVFDIYEATLMWGGALRRIAVDAADTDPLLGMALLYHYELTVQVVEGVV
jgi:predicted aspartyl protease